MAWMVSPCWCSLNPSCIDSLTLGTSTVTKSSMWGSKSSSCHPHSFGGCCDKMANEEIFQYKSFECMARVNIIAIWKTAASEWPNKKMLSAHIKCVKNLEPMVMPRPNSCHNGMRPANTAPSRVFHLKGASVDPVLSQRLKGSLPCIGALSKSTSASPPHPSLIKPAMSLAGICFFLARGQPVEGKDDQRLAAHRK